jgi:protein TonB
MNTVGGLRSKRKGAGIPRSNERGAIVWRRSGVDLKHPFEKAPPEVHLYINERALTENSAPLDVEGKGNIYRSSSDVGTDFWERMVGAWVLGFVVTAALFMVLPLVQMISAFTNESQGMASIDRSMPPPPPPPQEALPPPEKKETDEFPEMNKSIPKLKLNQLELALNPGTGGASASGGLFFHFSFDVMEELEMIFELSEIERIPRAISQTQPIHPHVLRRAGIEGQVDLQFIVTSTGRVRSVSVLRGKEKEFVRAAIVAVRQWMFEPGMKDGKAVNVRMRVPIVFTLKK